MALALAVCSANVTNRHDDVSMHSRWWQAPRFVTTGRRRCQTETIEMYGSRPTLIFAVVFVCQERARALSGFVSPGGSCVRQTVIGGVARHARVVANATDPFDTLKRVIVRKVVNPIDGLSHSKSITDRRTPFANSVLPFAFNLRK